jgi:putative SbcD/Mre11-related phosphoesterase
MVIKDKKEETKMRYIGKCLLISSEGERVLVVGDLHLGYEEALNRTGVLVGRKMFDEMISDLNAVFGEVGKVDKVVLLGDVKHDFGGISRQEWKDVNAILDYFESMAKKIIVVRGNHDTILEPILKKRKTKLLGVYIWNGFAFSHGDEDYEEIWNKEINTIVVGHGHPAVRLNEPKGIKSEKYKCFLVGKFKGKEMIVVPSFIDFYVGSDPRDDEMVMAWDVNWSNFDVFVVSEDAESMNALSFGKLKKLK